MHILYFTGHNRNEGHNFVYLAQQTDRWLHGNADPRDHEEDSILCISRCWSVNRRVAGRGLLQKSSTKLEITSIPKAGAISYD